ncbi:hypothetical protein D3C77_783880 [compost metagenome]
MGLRLVEQFAEVSLQFAALGVISCHQAIGQVKDQLGMPLWVLQQLMPDGLRVS